MRLSPDRQRLRLQRDTAVVAIVLSKTLRVARRASESCAATTAEPPTSELHMTADRANILQLRRH